MFYRFNQNNSGGCFHADDRVCIHVIVEAHCAAEANDRAESLGIYFNGVEDDRDCACCGDRWYPAWGQGDDEPQIYGHHPATYNEQYVEPGEVFCRVYYLDGHVAEFRRPAPSLIAGNQHC